MLFEILKVTSDQQLQMKLGHINISEIISQPKVMDTADRKEFDTWTGIRHVAQLLEPE